MHDFDLNLLPALEALFEEQNVTRAAKRLHVTQPAMSHTLQRLRETWRDPLFVRTAQGIAPTARALSLQPALKRALGDVRSMLTDETFDPARARRHFVLATPDFGQVLLLPQLLRQIRDEAPGVTIRAFSRPDDFLERLETGTLDVVIGAAEAESDLTSAFRRQVLVKTRPVLVAREGHSALKRPLTLQRFAALPHIQLAFRLGLSGPVDALLKEANLTANVALAMGDIVAAMFVAAQSDLVVVAGDLIADVIGRVLPLRAHPIPGVGASRPISQIWHERAHRDPAHAWFRAKLHAVAAGLGVASEPRRHRRPRR